VSLRSLCLILHFSNHALHVTERHTAITHSVAACLSRVADGEWLRTCEGVRRFSVTIGQLGEWRAFCEGGWTGPIPNDLPSIDDQQPTAPNTNYTQLNEGSSTIGRIPETNSSPSSTNRSSEPPETLPISLPLQSPRNDLTGEKSQVSSTDQISSLFKTNPSPPNNGTDKFNSLSNFPFPPTHFPIPPIASPSPTLTDQGRQPRSSHADQPQVYENRSSISRGDPTGTTNRNQTELGTSNRPEAPPGFLSRKPSLTKYPEDQSKNPPTSPKLNYLRQSLEIPLSSNLYSKGDYDEREFGVRNDGYGSRTMDAIRSKPMDRSDSVTSGGSVVAAVRNQSSSNVSSFNCSYTHILAHNGIEVWTSRYSLFASERV
jgi:hypothetical protein